MGGGLWRVIEENFDGGSKLISKLVMACRRIGRSVSVSLIDIGNKRKDRLIRTR